MEIKYIETLIQCGAFSTSEEWQSIRCNIIEAVTSVDWPLGTGKFTIYPESGKKRGEGNGVKPIKNLAISYLKDKGWSEEYGWPIGENSSTSRRPGKMDAAILSTQGLVAFEWETGNISSSHRALNKLALGLLTKEIKAGVLVVPSRKLYRFLTDRIGNIDELSPYFPLWKSIPCEGILEIFVIEHDAESYDVPRIPKGTDGRATN
jgi:hypothetical protein